MNNNDYIRYDKVNEICKDCLFKYKRLVGECTGLLYFGTNKLICEDKEIQPNGCYLKRK